MKTFDYLGKSTAKILDSFYMYVKQLSALITRYLFGPTELIELLTPREQRLPQFQDEHQRRFNFFSFFSLFCCWSQHVEQSMGQYLVIQSTVFLKNLLFLDSVNDISASYV